ncbi:hypothetical protein D3C78_1602360 [compost metagenome]
MAAVIVLGFFLGRQRSEVPTIAVDRAHGFLRLDQVVVGLLREEQVNRSALPSKLFIVGD